METKQVWTAALSEAEQVVNKFLSDSSNIEKCVAFTDLLMETYKKGGNAFISGNGGSHCDAMHFAEEWTGRFRKERKPMGALALGDPSHTTCVANDYGFEHIFSRQLQGLGRKGDLYIGISTSGNSQNVINAIEAAKEIGMKTVGLLGKDGGKMKEIVDLPIIVPAQTSDRIQEVHIKIIHTVIESVERGLFPENY
jgi:D-sedoheptulose 7-phosphate isomerase